jgi:hypothetical protein
MVLNKLGVSVIPASFELCDDLSALAERPGTAAQAIDAAVRHIGARLARIVSASAPLASR